MTYYRLTDNRRKDMIVKADGKNQYIHENGQWQLTGIMLEYFCDESDLYSMYEEISEKEANEYVTKSV